MSKRTKSGCAVEVAKCVFHIIDTELGQSLRFVELSGFEVREYILVTDELLKSTYCDIFQVIHQVEVGKVQKL